MLQKNIYSFTVLKHSKITIINSSYQETSHLLSFSNLIKESNYMHLYCFDIFLPLKSKREVANIVLKDLLHSVRAWRQLRGYPQGGNTTYTNAKSSRKNKLLLFYRLEQFNSLFGQKKRNIYPTLIKAEYTNKLWYYTWVKEWIQANKFATKMANVTKKNTPFNPVLLAEHQTNGYVRIGKASKIGKAKKLTKVFTLGLPVFFSRYIYYQHPPHGFPFKIFLKDEVNKKLGKRIKKKKNATKKL